MILLTGCGDKNINPIPPSTNDNPYDGLVYIQPDDGSTDCSKICKKQAKEFDCWDNIANYIYEIKKCECSLLYCKKPVEGDKQGERS